MKEDLPKNSIHQLNEQTTTKKLLKNITKTCACDVHMCLFRDVCLSGVSCIDTVLFYVN